MHACDTLDQAKANLSTAQGGSNQQEIAEAEMAVAEAEAVVDHAKKSKILAEELSAKAQIYADAANVTAQFKTTTLAAAKAEVEVKEEAYAQSKNMSESAQDSALMDLMTAKDTLMNKTRELWHFEWNESMARKEFEKAEVAFEDLMLEGK